MRERVRVYGGELHAGRARRRLRGRARSVLASSGSVFRQLASYQLRRRMIRVLIADDQALVRAGFRMILDAEDDIDVIGEASTATRRSSRRGG